jgi:selenium metabolism protein YedF
MSEELVLECQGLPCPQPVLKSKKAIEDGSPSKLVVIVDNSAAKENVSRFLGTAGYATEVVEKGSEFVITGTKGEDAGECPACEVMSEAEIADVVHHKNLVFIASNVIGSGDDELGGKLMLNFLLTLKEMGSDLWRIVILNGGVKITVEGHPCLDALKELEQSGVSILVCGTCLEFFGLSEANQVGEVTNMLDVVTSFQLATKTIRV